ncbi:MAG TPA: hypothetical protein VN646_19165 [Candidatus Acidoferrum sp.]|jgi:hypothetical protein|nr:hypothetical protein [Candidatus Acidoferrum sp.]
MWRYKLVPMGRPRESQIEAWEAKLDELGGEGWEAVAVIEEADGWCVLLKMPREVGTF